jgi:intracellular septation protein
MPFFHFLLSFFIEFGPLVGFLSIAFLYGFFPGVYALIILSFLSLLFSKIRDKRLPIFSIYAASAVFIFGSLSIYYHNQYLVVFEYTLYNFAFALAALWGYFYKQPIMKKLFPTMFVMKERGWQIMSVSWGIIFVVAGFLNEYFWWYENEHTWLVFRAYMLVFSTIFGALMFFVSRHERLPGSNSWGLKKY